ncbi:copper chaperone PCu(A)C [Tabrizicola sp. J26]|uniref:copper chaperone PCu(A)C n=1 Tax=Alitabrizicola rongguiensis TaxID=2909234 RepID=UPI001F16F50C|nr:copper chaperone PCu(A)C [Tabrizicola rongguiensis]MCF1710027.1 copper chaperone PCu(A)C [Tabrizicola rongguiensis]
MTLTRLFGLTAALFVATSAAAHEFKVGTLEIIHPSIPQPAATAMAAGGYLAISNEGPEPDRLIGARADFAKETSIHESKTDAAGVTSMSEVKGIDIPPGDTAVLERGGYHIMFMGLSQPLKEGDMVPVTLIFEKAGEVPVEFMVDPANGEADHSQHTHSSGTGG